MIMKSLAGVAGFVAISFATLQACSAQTPPAPDAESAVNWEDVPLVPGTWVYRQDERGSIALYGEPNQDAAFLVRCNMDERRIYFSLAGSLADGNGTMAFKANHGDASYAAQNVPGAQNYIVAMTPATDEYLDAIAFTRGRIAVTVTGQPLLTFPNWPEMTRVFEDCRA